MKEIKKSLLLIIIVFEMAIIVWLLGHNYTTKQVFSGNFNRTCKDRPSSALFYTPPEEYYKNFDRLEISVNPFTNCIVLSQEMNISTLKANCKMISDGGFIKIKPWLLITNSEGIREIKEYTSIKTNTAFRIAAVGDSFTFGQGVNNDATWPKALENYLNKHNKEKKYEVLNFGVSGYNLKEYFEIIKFKVLKYNPDLIIIGYVGNDVIIDNEENIEILSEKLSGIVDLKQRLNISISFEKERAFKILNNRYLVSDTIKLYFNKIFNVTKNIPVIIVNLFSGEAYILEDLTKSFKNWYFLDPSEILVNKASENGICREDLIVDEFDSHPNELAYRLFSEIIYNFLQQEKLINRS